MPTTSDRPGGGDANGPDPNLSGGTAVGLEEKARRASSDAARRRGRADRLSGIERSAAALHPGFLRAVAGSRSGSAGGSRRGSRGGSATSSGASSSSSSRPRPPIERCPTGASYHTRETLGTNAGRAETALCAGEYERLREENRLLREEHARRHAAGTADGGRRGRECAPPREADELSGGGELPPSSDGAVGRQKRQPVTHSTHTAPVSNAASSKVADDEDDTPGGNDGGGAKENNGIEFGRPGAPSGPHGSDHPARPGGTAGGQNAILQPIKNLTRLTGTLFRKPSEDEMSFFVSGPDGQVEKRAVALVCQESDEAVMTRPGGGAGADASSGGDGNTTIASGRTDGTGRGGRRAPQSPRPPSGAGACGPAYDDPLRSVRKVATAAARLTRGSVDAIANDAVPRIVGEIDRAARVTARAAARTTRESVDGLGMMVTDLARTPARSNVNGHRNVQFANASGGCAGRAAAGPGVVGGYVHDPDYEVANTPTGHENRGRMDVPYGRHFNPSTPGVLFGAVAAAKCDLPPDHPEGLEGLPDGMPRVLVVHGDWEERAGFVPMSVLEGDTVAASAADGDERVAAAMREGGHERRASEPVDLDKVEVETVASGDDDGGGSSGSELELRLSNGFDEDDELPVRPGGPAADEVGRAVNFECDGGKDDDEDVSGEVGAAVPDGGDGPADVDGEDPRNHSMWVAAPADEDVDGDDYAMEVGQVCMTDLIDCDEEEDMLASTPNSATSGATFFVGDVDAVGESPPSPGAEDGGAVPSESAAAGEDGKEAAEEKTAADMALERAFEVFGDAVPLDGPGAAVPAAGKADEGKASAGEVEDLAARIESIGLRLQDFPGVSLPAAAAVATSPAPAAPGAMADVPFETPHSVRTGGRPMSMSEFKAMNGVHGRPHAGADGGRPSTSPDGRRMTRDSESTDLSLYSNWAEPAASGPRGGNKQRELRGRILLVRIKRKITKVGKKAHRFFLPFGRNNKPPRLSGGDFVVSLRSDLSSGRPHGALPNSPGGSVVSAVSVASSLVAGGRIIGAAPPAGAGGPPAPSHFLYGAINYGAGRGTEESSAGDDELPPPPAAGLQLPAVRGARSAEEDAASFLAEVMRKYSDDDGEDSVMLLVTPREDGTEEVSHVITAAADGTPVRIQDVLGNASDVESDVSSPEPSNLQALFAGGAGDGASPLQIVDAVEIEGQGILLTPRNAPSGNNASSVFRPSSGPSLDAGDGLLAPSANGTHDDDEEEEDESLLFHDGETLIRPSSTMGDHTIGTAASGRPTSVPQKTPAVDEEEAERELPSNTAPARKTFLSPGGGVPVSRTAEMQRSFLFSPNNLGRAEPSVRAAQRAHQHKTKSITLLPPSSETNKSGTAQLTVKHSYSFESRPTDVEGNDVLDRPVRKGVVAPVAEDRQFSFKTTKGKFEEDDCARPETPVDAAETSRRYPVTPFPDEAAVANDEVETAIETPVDAAETSRKYPVTPFPDVAAVTEAIHLNSPTDAPPATSPSSASVYSKGKRKSPPKKKSPPTKSTAKMLRQGNVRARASAINERAAALSKKERRGTNGDGVLAPRHSRLKSTFLSGASYYNRSVPIGIAKTYTRDSDSYHSLSIGASSSLEEASAGGGKATTSYASQYIADEEPRQSISWGSAVSTDASSCAESSTGADPFSSLLAAADRDSYDDGETVAESDEGRVSDAHNKENEANLLPFRTAESHVKPSELNHHQHPALSPQPMPPQTWRRLAAAAKEKKEGGDSARFRTEKSVRNMFSGI